jgi:phage terminase Nu1 subunit (DNA packaging protein)
MERRAREMGAELGRLKREREEQDALVEGLRAELTRAQAENAKLKEYVADKEKRAGERRLVVVVGEELTHAPRSAVLRLACLLACVCACVPQRRRWRRCCASWRSSRRGRRGRRWPKTATAWAASS